MDNTDFNSIIRDFDQSRFDAEATVYRFLEGTSPQDLDARINQASREVTLYILEAKRSGVDSSQMERLSSLLTVLTTAKEQRINTLMMGVLHGKYDAKQAASVIVSGLKPEELADRINKDFLPRINSAGQKVTSQPKALLEKRIQDLHLAIKSYHPESSPMRGIYSKLKDKPSGEDLEAAFREIMAMGGDLKSKIEEADSFLQHVPPAEKFKAFKFGLVLQRLREAEKKEQDRKVASPVAASVSAPMLATEPPKSGTLEDVFANFNPKTGSIAASVEAAFQAIMNMEGDVKSKHERADAMQKRLMQTEPEKATMFKHVVLKLEKEVKKSQAPALKDPVPTAVNTVQVAAVAFAASPQAKPPSIAEHEVKMHGKGLAAQPKAPDITFQAFWDTFATSAKIPESIDAHQFEAGNLHGKEGEAAIDQTTRALGQAGFARKTRADGATPDDFIKGASQWKPTGAGTAPIIHIGDFALTAGQLGELQDSYRVSYREGDPGEPKLEAAKLQSMITQSASDDADRVFGPRRMVSSDIVVVRDEFCRSYKASDPLPKLRLYTTNMPDLTEEGTTQDREKYLLRGEDGEIGINPEPYTREAGQVLGHYLSECAADGLQMPVITGIGLGVFMPNQKARSQAIKCYVDALEKQLLANAHKFNGVVFSAPGEYPELINAVQEMLERNQKAGLLKNCKASTKSALDIANEAAKAGIKSGILNAGDPSFIPGQYFADKNANIALEELLALRTTMVFSQHPHINREAGNLARYRKHVAV